jgi:hypothetical protein
MTKATLSHPDCPCRALVLELLTTSSTPLTMFQIRDTIRAEHQYTPTEIRAAVLALLADELLDCEQLNGAPTRVYFLPHRPPNGVVWIPAHQVPRITAIAPRQWYSPLGLAA